MDLNYLSGLKHLLKGRIERLNEKIDEALHDLKNDSGRKSTLYEAAKHAMGGGKRLRPLLCLLTCDGIGGDSSKILPTAAGIEMIHAFTLVHDDIMDGDELRRGKPALKSLWGDNLAILTGDTLFALAYKHILSNSGVDGIDANRVNRVLGLSVDACLKLAQGQMMDISLPIDNDWRNEIIKLKTAPLFSLATTAGAILGNGSEEEIECMGKYGLYLGMAFQIEDDILNLAGNADRVGKPNGGDLKNGKFTLPIAHALREIGKEERDRILSSPKKESVIMEMMTKRGSIEYAEKIAQKLAYEAKQNLSVIKGEDERAALEFLADYSVKRGE